MWFLHRTKLKPNNLNVNLMLNQLSILNFLCQRVFGKKLFAVCTAFIIVLTYRKFSDSPNYVKPAANSLQNICIGKRVEVRSLLSSNWKYNKNICRSVSFWRDATKKKQSENSSAPIRRRFSQLSKETFLLRFSHTLLYFERSIGDGAHRPRLWDVKYWFFWVCSLGWIRREYCLLPLLDHHRERCILLLYTGSFPRGSIIENFMKTKRS